MRVKIVNMSLLSSNVCLRLVWGWGTPLEWVRASNPLLQLRWRVALERLILGIIDISQVGMLGWLKVSSTEKTAAQNGVHRKPACRVN
jgi:hypothetical protein